MPGKTGKRSKPVRPCGRCGKDLRGQSYFRRPKADYCEPCFMKTLQNEGTAKKTENCGREDLSKAMEAHAASQAAWEQDFGDRPVYNYDTGKKIADTASEYLRKQPEGK